MLVVMIVLMVVVQLIHSSGALCQDLSVATLVRGWLRVFYSEWQSR